MQLCLTDVRPSSLYNVKRLFYLTRHHVDYTVTLECGGRVGHLHGPTALIRCDSLTAHRRETASAFLDQEAQQGSCAFLCEWLYVMISLCDLRISALCSRSATPCKSYPLSPSLSQALYSSSAAHHLPNSLSSHQQTALYKCGLAAHGTTSVCTSGLKSIAAVRWKEDSSRYAHRSPF